LSLMVINATHFISDAYTEQTQGQGQGQGQSCAAPTPADRQAIALRVALDVAEQIGKPAQS